VTGEDVYLSATDGYRIFIQTTAREFERDTYHLLVLVNPNAAIKGITEEGDLLSELDAVIDNPAMYGSRTVGEGEDAYHEPAYFLMQNVQGLVELEPSRFYETEERALSNPSRISLERMTAKVECNYTGEINVRSTNVAPFGRFVMLLDYNNQLAAPWGDDYDIPEDWELLQCPVEGCGGTFNRHTKQCSNKPYIHTYDGLGLISERVRYMVATDLTWEVDVVNKKSYWLRQLTEKAGGSVMETQGDSDRENFYAEDPNFTGLPSSTTLVDNFTYITDKHFVSGDAAYSAKKLFPPDNDTYRYYNYWSWDEAEANRQPVYIPENTMSQAEQKGDRVTRLLFRAVLKREQFGENDTEQEPEAVATIGDFFVFKGGRKDVEDYTYNNKNYDGSTFYILRPEDMAIYASAETTDHIHIYLKEGMLEAIAAFKTAYKTATTKEFDWTTPSNNLPFVSENLSFYRNGVMYYEVPIQHFSQAAAGGYGRFGVVRNNWYKLNVVNMISIGEPVLPLPTTGLIEPAVRSAMPETRSSSNSLIRNQSIIF
ncbi:fimbria major subunit, partial [Parabacteroides sp. OttesenSCG-928-N08]|nr:fimbria major subunit [Parabacteroides sp. OttesenSCG-928-N08]